MPKEYFIWCDESLKKGKFYSNFYGGILISSSHIVEVLSKLKKAVHKANITDEIKWQKVNAFHLPQYTEILSIFFKLVKQNKIKVRIMFTQNANVPKGLQKHQLDNEYFLLYYQFFKHAFGLKYANATHLPIYIRAYFDNLPDTVSKSQQFKEYIKGLESTREFQLAKLKIRKEDITEVDSKNHLPMQYLDVILGAMAFRLNNLHKEKPIGKKRRGERTKAKEKLYKHISKHVRELKKGFNIGVSTGREVDEDTWHQGYRHWLFVPREHDIDEDMYK